MAKILVAGGLPDPGDLDLGLRAFAAALSEQLVEQGHTVLGGCQTELDRVVAQAAADKATELGREPEACVVSYVGRDAPPAHNIGRVIQSQLPKWDLIGSRLIFPEPVAQSDVVVLLGGWEGTHRAANWARLAKKPILPLASFGLAAREVYSTELGEFDERYATRIPKGDYEALNRVLVDRSEPTLVDFAKQVVTLAERVIAPSDVFVIMSFAEKPELVDAYDTFVASCEKEGFKAFKVDHHLDESKRIVSAIIDSIRRSAFIIADVTEARPNVYYELGYAQSMGKPVIVTARKDTPLPFDIFDVPTLFWENQKSLRTGLEERIGGIKARFGR